MKILVTGCCGFIGSHLCKKLLEMGHYVVGLDNLSTGNQNHLPPEVEFIKGDIRDDKTVSSAMLEVHGCIHLAAIASVSISEVDPIYAHEVNARGTLNIFQAAQKHRQTIPIVYASSAAVYGHNESNEVGLPSKKISPISIYGADKAVNEYHAKSFWLTKKQPSCGLRLFNVYGTGQNLNSLYSGVITKFINRMLEEKPLMIYGDGSQTRDFIHVSDVVQYMANAILKLSSGSEVFEICSGHATSINNLVETLLKVTEKKADIVHLKSKVHDILHSIGNPSAATDALAYTAQISLEEGLREIWNDISNRKD